MKMILKNSVKKWCSLSLNLMVGGLGGCFGENALSSLVSMFGPEMVEGAGLHQKSKGCQTAAHSGRRGPGSSLVGGPPESFVGEEEDFEVDALLDREEVAVLEEL